VSLVSVLHFDILLTFFLLDQILVQKEAYGDLWCSCQIGDAYIDLSIHLIDTYTRSKVNVAPPLNPNPTLLDDCTRNPPNTFQIWWVLLNGGMFLQWYARSFGWDKNYADRA